MGSTIQEAFQRAGVWCEPVSGQDLSNSGVGGENHRGRSPYPASKRLSISNLGGTAEYTFRPRDDLRRKVFL